MSLHQPRSEPRRPSSARNRAKPRPAPSRRSPSHLEELESAAQTEVSEISSEVDASLADESSQALRSPPAEEGDRLPVVESGLSVDPEDLGLQFLRDATDQGNFESDVTLEREEGDVPVGDLTAEAMLAAREAARELSEKPTPRVEGERSDDQDPSLSDVDLRSRAIREGSLFDQPTEQGTRSPRVKADDDDTEEEPRGARETAEAQALARLQRLTRPRPVRKARSRSRR
jgi:hypothetical protein